MVVDRYIDNPDFQPAKIESVSKACTAMCTWVRAMYKYYHVARDVEPKKQALAGAEAELEVVMAALKEKQAILKEVEDRIEALEANYTGAITKKESLQKEVSDCTVKLDRADRLIGGLGGEKVRWIETVGFLEKAEVNVVGDVLIAAGGVAYLGTFTGPFRQSLEAQWSQSLKTHPTPVPHTEHTGLHTTLADPVAIRQWNIWQLPTDNVSTENAIILSKSRRWGLMIDPQVQANRWIKNMNKERGLDVLKLSEKDFLRSLVNGVRFGKVCLENISYYNSQHY